MSEVETIALIDAADEIVIVSECHRQLNEFLSSRRVTELLFLVPLSALGWYHTLVRSIRLLLSVRRWRRYKSIEMNGTI